MKINQALETLRFYTGTVSDITGKSVNALFTNPMLVQQLNFALDEYARTTKAIEDIHSFVLDTTTSFIDAPQLALRSESYRAILYWVNGRSFPGDMQGFANVYSNFPYPTIVGIPTWFMPWGTTTGDRIYVFPANSTAGHTTTLTGDVTDVATTLPVATTAGFLTRNGKVTIGNEKIHYQYVDATNFYGCERGQEQTSATNHSSTSTVSENNVWLFYSRLHTPITCIGNTLSEAMQNKDLELPEEHIETVLKYAAYNLIVKVDPTRATSYKTDWVAFLEQAKLDIRKGRSRIKSGRTIRDPYDSESSISYAPNRF
jgi:hypothetical protein